MGPASAASAWLCSANMADPVMPPDLPPETPTDLLDFVACRSDRVTIRSGRQAWMRGAELTVAPGDTPNAGTLAVGIAFFTFSFPVSIVSGRLVVDTSGSHAPSEIQNALTGFANDLNAWFRQNGKGLGPAIFAVDGLTLTKVALAPQPRPAGQPARA
jgi:hypothetical protein